MRQGSPLVLTWVLGTWARTLAGYPRRGCGCRGGGRSSGSPLLGHHHGVRLLAGTKLCCPQLLEVELLTFLDQLLTLVLQLEGTAPH